MGDVVQCSYNKPPERALVYRDDRNIFLPPEGYDLVLILLVTQRLSVAAGRGMLAMATWAGEKFGCA